MTATRGGGILDTNSVGKLEAARESAKDRGVEIQIHIQWPRMAYGLR